MMIYPPIDELKEKVGNGYIAVNITAKRAKQLENGKKPLVEPEENEKSISIAAREIYEGKILPSAAEETKADKDKAK